MTNEEKNILPEQKDNVVYVHISEVLQKTIPVFVPYSITDVKERMRYAQDEVLRKYQREEIILGGDDMCGSLNVVCEDVLTGEQYPELA